MSCGLTLLVYLLIPACLAQQTALKQTPKAIVAKVGSEALIDCDQVTTDHNFMYWYHQGRNQGLKLIALLQRDQKPNYEDEQEDNYEVGTKRGYKHSYLKVKSVTSHAQGVYFCASSLAQ
ncbi:hypothetical protein GDO81_028092 [Engystomops pustulosus]|uniref:Ig-like domain-containing protein n=1 Tax=Engystomops pustulosus TaxID=76066 RepID=A0AAV6ZLK7_ENGPU|nr:hypothetical protein GDO81_028092 [Engystomops pustulosus]